MTEHTLKTLAPYWDAIARGDKTFEVRRDDRGFQRSDIVVLERWHHRPWGSGLTQRLCPDRSAAPLRFRIGYVLTGGQHGIEPGYVVFSLEPERLGAADG